MSDISSPTNECISCQLFLRVGIPVVVGFLILVIGCIIWFDRYDKHQLQKKLKEKRERKSQKQHNSTDDISFDSTSNEETDLSIYAIPSNSNVNTAELSGADRARDLNDMERGNRTVTSIPPSASVSAVVVPSYRAQRFHTLIQQVHDENLTHLTTVVQENDDEVEDRDRKSGV